MTPRAAAGRARWRPWLRAGTGTVLVATPLALGGAHPSVNAGVAVALAGLLALTGWASPREARLPFGPAAAAVALALFVTLAQLVPLPPGVLAVLSPAAHDVVSLSRGAGAWAPVSLDPAATAHEATKLAALLAAALLAPALFHGRGRQLAGWIGFAGVLVLAVGLGHAVLGVTSPYGVLSRSETALVSSFVNPNHLAAFLGMAALAAAARAVTARAGKRLAWTAAAGLAASGVLLSLSRGGILSLALVTLALVAGALARGTAPRSHWLWAAAATAVLVATVLAQAPLVHELWTLSRPGALEKVELWRPVPALVHAFPWTGVGRGALAAAYPRYAPGAVTATVTHLENEPLQAVVDWGLLPGLAVLGLVALALARAVARARHGGEWPWVAAALGFLALEGLGDFALSLTSVAVPSVMLLALASAASTTAPHARRLEGSAGRLAVVVLGASLAVASATLGSLAVWHDLERDTARLRRALESADASRRSAALADASAWHPGDYLLPLVAADRELATPDGTGPALRLANHAMLLAPGFDGAHRLAARALRAAGARDQAVLEYRLACRYAPQSTEAVAAEVWAAAGAAGVAALGADGGCGRGQVASFLLAHGAPREALLVAQRDANQDPELAVTRSRALAATGDQGAALEAAAELRRRWPARADGYLVGAEELRAAGRLDEALALLRAGATASVDPYRPLFAAAALQLARGDTEGARATALKALPLAAGQSALAATEWLLGRTYVAEDRRALALRHFARARDLAPDAASYRIDVARTREALGDLEGAEAELTRAELELGGTPQLDEELARVRALARREREAARMRELTRSRVEREP